MKKIAFLLIVFLVFTGTACYAQQDAGGEDDAVTIIGRVHRFSYEGGFYGIQGDDGRNYKPLYLSSGFQVEGLRVKVTAKIITKKFLFRPWGTPIQIIKIERYEEGE